MPLHSLPRFLCLGTILVASAVTLFHKDNYRVLLLLQFLQIVAGCFGALICFVRLMKERDLYLEAKQTLRIADESRKLVHSLIPENVMTKLVHHGNAGEFLGANIPFCIVMFCSLGPQQLLKSKTSAEIFEILDQVFEKFDDAVDNHGMYKYQNVGDWYIIMCPRAARPFDQKLQEEPYPRSHVRSMVHLAAELIRIAKNHEVQGTKLNLKIGMHCGPAAGAVVGSHRAFYCVYGDTTNTAARMCKYAGSDQILCTCSFAKIAGGCRGLPFSFEAKGVISVKGKGAMELYEVHERGSGGVGKELRRGLKRTTSVPNPSEKCVMFDQEQAIKLEEIQPTWMGAIEEAAGESGSSGAGAGAGAGAAGQAGISSDTIPFWTNFSDSDTEVKFLLDQARDHWLSISIGVLVHAYALLAAVEEAVTADSLQPIHYLSLYLQILLILTYFLFVLFYMIPELQFCHKFGHSIFSFQLLVSITHLLVGVNLRLLLCFYSILQYSAINLVLTGFTRSDAAIVVMLGAISLLPGYRMDHDFLLLSCFVLLTVSLALTVWKSKCLVYNEKVRYQYYEFIELELTRMKEVIYDLVPSNIVHQMIRNTLKLPCTMRRAVILQLDICNFTRMSQGSSAMEIAQMVHQLFSSFDQAVMKYKLFKIDTVGDAYIVAGWLSCDSDWANKEETRSSCSSMLNLARLMLRALMKHNRERGGKEKLSCRIGIAVGLVASGVLGRRHSRFYVVGQAMREVDLLEQTSLINNVHVSDKFMHGLGLLLSSSSSSSHDRGRSPLSERTRNRCRSVSPVRARELERHKDVKLEVKRRTGRRKSTAQLESLNQTAWTLEKEYGWTCVDSPSSSSRLEQVVREHRFEFTRDVVEKTRNLDAPMQTSYMLSCRSLDDNLQGS